MSSLSTAQSELSLGWQTFSSKGNSLICERWRRGIWPHLTSHISRSLGYAVILWQPPQQQWQSGGQVPHLMAHLERQTIGFACRAAAAIKANGFFEFH